MKSHYKKILRPCAAFKLLTMRRLDGTPLPALHFPRAILYIADGLRRSQKSRSLELRDFQYNNISGRLPVRCTFPATPTKSIGMATASPRSARTTAERLPSLQMMSFPSSRGAWMRMLTAVPKNSTIPQSGSMTDWLRNTDSQAVRQRSDDWCINSGRKHGKL